MPGVHNQNSFDAYLSVLGELEGFLDSHVHDLCLLVGDFNANFDRNDSLKGLLLDFIQELDLCACDLFFRDNIQYTYERDDSQNHSWIDHILCTRSSSHLVSNAHTLQSGSNLSDHLPLLFNFTVNCAAAPCLPQHPPSSCFSPGFLWSNVSDSNIESYRNYLRCNTPKLPEDTLSCTDPSCSQHNRVLDAYAEKLVSTLIIASKNYLPTRSPTYRTLTGWNYSCKDLKQDADFWYNIWNEAGRPPSGILSDIKKSTKRKYKSSVRQLKRKQNQLKREKLAKSFAKNKKDGFWSAVKQLKRGSTSRVSVVDDCTDSSDIANIFASNICSLLNTHSPALRNSMLASTKSKLTANELTGMSMSEDEVYDAVSSLKNRKTDSLGLSSEHLKYACPVIAHDLSAFFPACFRHCYLPKSLRDCVIVPVPKSGKDPSCSENYRPITLASTLSKVVEHIILQKYGYLLSSNKLQFGFKSGSSTTQCTALMKMVISRYLNRDSKVLGCFLDASKAFDRVDHGLLFQKLEKKGLPNTILTFFLNWYTTQSMSIQWSHNSLSRSFTVSNGVCQGGVLSPFLFAIYLDSLLEEL